VPLFFDGGSLGLQRKLHGPASEFLGGRDGGGFDAGEDLSVGGGVGNLLQLAGQEEGLFEDEGFQRGACFKGTAHEGLLPKKPSR
jgi:hypothetical protein